MDEQKMNQIRESLASDYDMTAREFLCIERAIRNAHAAGLPLEEADKFAREIIDAMES